MALIFSVQFIRKSNSESIDQGIYLASLVLGFVFVFLLKMKKLPNPPMLAINLFIFLGIFVLAIMGIEKHPTMDPKFLHDLWLGFGIYVLVMTLLLTPFIWTILLAPSSKRTHRITLTIMAVLISGLALPAMLQGGNSIIDTYHSEYVINELLAVPAGNIPYVDFIPQYGILYTWLIAPFSSFLQPNELVTLGLYLMSAGGIVAVALGVWLTYKAMNKRSLSLAILLVVPFTLVSKFPGRDDFPSTIIALLSAVPVRLVIGMALGMILLEEILGKSSKFRIYLLGIISGLSLWLNLDFAIAASGIVCLYVLLFLDKRRRVAFISSFSTGALLYPVAISIFGFEFRWNSIGFFVVQYTGGFMAEPIQTPGPVFIILPLITSLFFASTYPLYQERFRKKPIPAELRRAVLTANFFSLWSLIGFAYYLNRSYASGQMQILFLPLSVALASYIYYVTSQSAGLLPWTARTFFQPSQWRGKQLSSRLSYLPIAMVMSLPLATIIAFPNPTIEIERLTNAPAVNKWPNSDLADATRLAKTIRQSNPEILGSLGYLGNSGNFFEISEAIDSVNILNSPWDLPPAPTPLQVGCEFITKKNYDNLLLDDTGLALAKLFESGKLCNIYSLNPIPGTSDKIWSK